MPFTEHPLTFFTICTNQRKRLLDNNAVHIILRDVWTASKDRDGWFVGRYIIMPDHIHFFAMPSRSHKPIATWIKTWSARRISKEMETPSPIWQADYFDRFLRSADNYAEKWHYIEKNPVRAGLVSDEKAWPYQGIIHDLHF